MASDNPLQCALRKTCRVAFHRSTPVKRCGWGRRSRTPGLRVGPHAANCDWKPNPVSCVIALTFSSINRCIAPIAFIRPTVRGVNGRDVMMMRAANGRIQTLKVYVSAWSTMISNRMREVSTVGESACRRRCRWCLTDCCHSIARG